MKITNYVRRWKAEGSYKTLHAAGQSHTFCGKEINEMWFVESSAGLTAEDVTCKECRKGLSNL